MSRPISTLKRTSRHRGPVRRQILRIGFSPLILRGRGQISLINSHRFTSLVRPLTAPNRVRAKVDFLNRFNDLGCPVLTPKIFLSENQKLWYLPHVPLPQEGRIAIVTDVGSGMQWTRQRRKTGGAEADGKGVWSWCPDAGVKLAGDDLQATVAKEPGHRGEHVISVKTIAQGRPDQFGEPVVIMLVCFFISHARLRVHWAPGFPCALCFSEGQFSGKARTLSAPREGGCVRAQSCR
jgi:hypothetical protein